MAKLIIVDNNKNNLDTYNVFELLTDFTLRKGIDKYILNANSDKGLLKIELTNIELEGLINILKND